MMSAELAYWQNATAAVAVRAMAFTGLLLVCWDGGWVLCPDSRHKVYEHKLRLMVFR